MKVTALRVCPMATTSAMVQAVASAIVASGTNTTTVDGAFRHGLTGSPLANGVYDITWTFGGATIGTATVTRAC